MKDFVFVCNINIFFAVVYRPLFNSWVSHVQNLTCAFIVHLSMTCLLLVLTVLYKGKLGISLGICTEDNLRLNSARKNSYFICVATADAEYLSKDQTGTVTQFLLLLFWSEG